MRRHLRRRPLLPSPCRTAAVALAAGLLAVACAQDEDEDLGPVALSTIEAEIFGKSCTFSACHTGASPAGDLNLQGRTFARLVDAPSAQVSGRVRVVPGDPAASYLYEKLTAEVPAFGDPMPPGAPSLSAPRLALVEAWIAAGALDD